ncbi:MAG: HNH endonuclease [Phycisphaerae bacterium]|nr:HNH endonuclease [Phycisphaerae bacterium]
MPSTTRTEQTEVHIFGLAIATEKLIVGGGIVIIGFVLIFAGAMLHNLLVALVGAGTLGIVAWRGTVWRQRQRDSLREILQEMIRHDLKKQGLASFSLTECLRGFGATAKVAREAAESVYEEFYRKALADLRVTSKEHAILDALRDKLEMDAVTTDKIATRVRQARFHTEVSSRLADGALTAGEASDLRRIRAALSLTEAQALDSTRSQSVDAYRALFRQVISDGILSDEEMAQLQRFQEATGMDPAEAARITKDDALGLYRRTVTMVCQDGEVTESELHQLERLESILCLEPRDTAPLQEQIAKVRRLAAIRAGKLPLIKPQALLRNSEIAHYASACVYEWETATQTKTAEGKLFVTNQRLIFQSDHKSFDVHIPRILNVIRYSNAVAVEMTTTKAQGRYFVKDTELLEAILDAVIRYGNRVRSEGLDSSRSRHIPDAVKIEVWHRDGGRCVRCSATEYLEYDHIIPHSRGGSNSAQNVQLLCRKCNLAKGAEIV